MFKCGHYFDGKSDGFALVAQIEQIELDGTPKPEHIRWTLKPESIGNFSLWGYMKALFTAQPGFYRVVVFIIADEDVNETGEAPTREDAAGWLSEGTDALAEATAVLAFGSSHGCTALVYEFEVATADADPKFRDPPSPIAAEAHLQKTGIWFPATR